MRVFLCVCVCVCWGLVLLVEGGKVSKYGNLLFRTPIRQAVSFAHFPSPYTSFSSYHSWNGAVFSVGMLDV